MTTVFNGHKPKKKFAWSYTKLKNFETCAFRHQQIDVLKAVVEPQSEQLTYGNFVHKSLANAISKGVPLPVELIYLTSWVDKVTGGSGALFTEQQYAITEEFGKCSWFAPNAWFRGIGDVVRIDPPVALILDWKTGKVVEDSVQLALLAQCIFSHFPDVSIVRSEFVWLAHDAVTSEQFTRKRMLDIWTALLQRVDAMKQAHDTGEFPKKPSGLCVKWCPVAACEFHGKGSR